MYQNLIRRLTEVKLALLFEVLAAPNNKRRVTNMNENIACEWCQQRWTGTHKG